MRKRFGILFVIVFAMMTILAGCSSEEETTETTTEQPYAGEEIILATTTSTQDSGLLDVLIPAFEEATGISVVIKAVGTGEALQMAADGNCDVVMTHSPKKEQPLVDDGTLTNYTQIMYNDYVIVGPEDNPADIVIDETGAEAFAKIAETNSMFISRNDDSGTNTKEIDTWIAAGYENAGLDVQLYENHILADAPMGTVLQMANEEGAYTLTDRATWLQYSEEGNVDELVVLNEGDPAFANVYHIATVNPDKFEEGQINAGPAEEFVKWVSGPEGQEIVENYKIDGEPAFYWLPEGEEVPGK